MRDACNWWSWGRKRGESWLPVPSVAAGSGHPRLPPQSIPTLAYLTRFKSSKKNNILDALDVGSF